MDDASQVLKNVNAFKKVIAVFSSLTSVNLFYYSLRKLLINSDVTLSTSQDIHNYLAYLNYPNITVFPATLNNALTGFFVLNINNALVERNSMYRSYLESTGNQLIPQGAPRLHILDALSIDQVTRYVSDLGVIGSAAKRTDVSSKQPQVAKLQVLNNKNDIKLNNTDKSFIKALNYINANITKQLTLEDVSQHVYLSPAYLSRLFKSYFNVNFIDYINIRKIALACREIALTTIPINKISHRLGFSQASYFSKIFKQECSMTPSKYRLANPKIRKIYTIPRNISWLSNQTVYEASKEYFADRGINFKTHNLSGYLYVSAIGELSSDIRGGWVYTVNCQQPTVPANKTVINNKSVIQWFYTEVVDQ